MSATSDICYKDSFDRPWILARRRFLDSLENETQHTLFREANIENLYSTTANIERDDRQSTTRRIGRRLQPLINAVNDLGEAFDTFANAAPLYLAPIWGSIRVVLVLASKYQNFYERIIDTLSHIGDVLPRFRDYKRIFDSIKHSRLTEALSAAYADIITLCLEIKQTLYAQRRSTFKRLWKPLSSSANKQLEQAVERFRKHRIAVEAEASTAHMIAEADARAIIARDNILVEAKKKAERRNRLLSCLSKLNQGTKHHKLKKLCHSDTGLWLVGCNSYRTWLNSPGPSVFCLYGIPGCGKSVLASIAIEDICYSKRGNLSYHYCDYSDKRSLEPVNIFGTFTHGLLSRIEIPDAIANDIDNLYQNGDRIPDIDEVLQILSATIMEFDSVTLIIDGLDEVAEEDRHLICESLKELLNDNQHRLRLFVTSRDNAMSVFSTSASTIFPVLASPATLATDIDSFVRHSVRVLLETGRLKIRKSSLEETIITALVDGAKGMFLWVKYQLNDLCNTETDQAILEVLSDLPDSLAETYDRLLNRIKEPQRQDLIKRMFKWIICARRPLSLLELCEGISFSLKDRQWDCKKIPTDMSRLIRICGNLVVVDEETNVIEFAHYTLQQYILQEVAKPASPFHFNMIEANKLVGETCLAYLNFSDFDTQVVRHTNHTDTNMSTIEKAVITGSILDRNTIGYNAFRMWKFFHEHHINSSNIDLSKYLPQGKQFPPTETLSTRFCLLEYAAENWLYHTTDIFPELGKVLATVKRDSIDDILAAAKSAIFNSHVDNPRRYALFLDLAIRKQVLFEIRPWKISSCKPKERPHISLIGWALANNHLPLFCLSSIHNSNIKSWDLIKEAGKLVFPDEKHKRVTRKIRESFKAISFATPIAEIDPFKWLYSKLLDACHQGFLSALILLIPPLLDESYPASHILGHLVFEAATTGQNELVEFLCVKHRPIEIFGSYKKLNCNAMDVAALSGQTKLVKSLRDYGFTATSVLLKQPFLPDAVKVGNTDEITALLEAFKSMHNSQMDEAIQQQKVQALTAAFLQTDFKMLHLLLDHGVDPTLPDKSGRSAMVTAVIADNYEVVKAMLNRGYGAAEFYGSEVEAAPILWSAALGNLSITKLLVDYEADILPTPTCFWHNPLFVAAANGHFSIARLFWGFNDTFKNQIPIGVPIFEASGEISNKHTGNELALVLPFWAAKTNGYNKIAETLRQSNPSLDQVNLSKSPQFLAEAFWTIPPIIRLLITTSREHNIRNANGDSLLTIATVQGHIDAVDSLITAGEDPNLSNSYGQTPLSLAISGAYIEIVQLLIKVGAKPKEDEILIALDQKEHRILEELLAYGIDTEMKIKQKSRVVLGQTVPKGSTPLIIAARGGDLDAVQLLLKAGANSHATDEKYHKTAQAHAVQTKNADCAKVLEALNMKNHMNHLFGMNV